MRGQRACVSDDTRVEGGRCPDTIQSCYGALDSLLRVRESCCRHWQAGRNSCAGIDSTTPDPRRTTAALARRKREVAHGVSDERPRTRAQHRRNACPVDARARWRASQVRQSRHGQRIRIRCRLPQSPTGRSRRRAQRLGCCVAQEVLGGRGQLRHAESRRRVAVTRHLCATPGLPAAKFLWYRTKLAPRRPYGFQDRELHGRWARRGEARPIVDGYRRRRVFPARSGAGQKQGSPLNRSAVY